MALAVVHFVLTLVFWTMLLFVHQSGCAELTEDDPLFRMLPEEGLMNCSQCNMRLRNVNNLCNNPREMTNCIGCMKTVTKVRLRDSGYIDGWKRLSEVTSRYCMRPGNRNVKPEGCYKQLNNGGYTERCYCYSNNCNSRGHRFDPNVITPLTFASLTAVLLGHLCRASS